MLRHYKCKYCGHEGVYRHKGVQKEFCNGSCCASWHNKNKKKEEKKEKEEIEINGCTITPAEGRCDEFLDGSCKGEDCLMVTAKRNWPGWEKVLQ